MWCICNACIRAFGVLVGGELVYVGVLVPVGMLVGVLEVRAIVGVKFVDLVVIKNRVRAASLKTLR